MESTQNTNNGFIKIPRKIIGNLKNMRCLLYVYLLYICTVQGTNTVKLKYGTCANFVGTKYRVSVTKMMKYLAANGYIQIEKNYSGKYGLQTCNTITVPDYDPKSAYFLLPAELMELNMFPAAFELMLCLYMFAYYNPYCFPSYMEISSVSKLSRATIWREYKTLEELGVIKKQNYIRKDGGKGHNRYFLTKKIEKLVGKENAACLFSWIDKKKELCFDLWQTVKNVLKGNVQALDDICRQEMRCREYAADGFENIFSVPCRETGIKGFVKRKLSSFCTKIRSIFSGFLYRKPTEERKGYARI